MPGAQMTQSRTSHGLAGAPHLPHQALIEAYGEGGFRFGGLSHRGSILSLPEGIWAFAPKRVEEIDHTLMETILARAEAIDTLLIGTGTAHWRPPAEWIAACRAQAIALDAMPTRPAVRTYNIMAGENRRLAAALIAID